MPAVCAQAKRSRKSGFHWPKIVFFFFSLCFTASGTRFQVTGSLCSLWLELPQLIFIVRLSAPGRENRPYT